MQVTALIGVVPTTDVFDPAVCSWLTQGGNMVCVVGAVFALCIKCSWLTTTL